MSNIVVFFSVYKSFPLFTHAPVVPPRWRFPAWESLLHWPKHVPQGDSCSIVEMLLTRCCSPSNPFSSLEISGLTIAVNEVVQSTFRKLVSTMQVDNKSKNYHLIVKVSKTYLFTFYGAQIVQQQYSKFMRLLYFIKKCLLSEKREIVK